VARAPSPAIFDFVRVVFDFACVLDFACGFDFACVARALLPAFFSGPGISIESLICARGVAL
jgi:hypothetical protein